MVRRRQPVAGACRVGLGADSVEELRRLRRLRNCLLPPAEPAERLCSATKELGAATAVLADGLQQLVVSVDGFLELPGCEKQIRLEPIHRRPIFSDQVLDRYPEPLAEERQRRQGWLCVSPLEAAPLGSAVDGRQHRLQRGDRLHRDGVEHQLNMRHAGCGELAKGGGQRGGVVARDRL